jgi:hypothetical protein
LADRVANRNPIHAILIPKSLFDTAVQKLLANNLFSGPVFIPKLYHGKNRTFLLTTLRGFFQLGGVPASTVTVPTSAMLNGGLFFGGSGFPI